MELATVTVAEKTWDCLILLKSSVETRLHREGSMSSFAAVMRQSLEGLKKWADNIGVFAADQAAIDHRLRGAPHLISALLSMLDVLEVQIKSLFSIDLIEAANAHPVNDTISWLHRFSRVIRISGTRDHFSRAVKFPLTDSEGNDNSKLFEQYVRSVLSIRHGFLNGGVLERLVVGTVLRRRRFLYACSYQNKLKRRDPHKVFLIRAIDVSSSDSLNEAPKEALSAMKSGTIATTPPTDIAAPGHDEADASTTASTWSIPAEHVQFSPPPKPDPDSKEWECPYCCLILPVEVYTNVDKWKRHVLRDTRPYVCIYERCPYPEECFSSSRQWHQHLRKPHRTEWVCPLFDQHQPSASHLGPRIFDSQKALEDHLSAEHDQSFSPTQILVLSKRSTRSAPRLKQCPLCDWPSPLASSHANTEDEYRFPEVAIFKHVSRHLINAALISLPWRDDVDFERDEDSATVLSKQGQGTPEISERLSDTLELSLHETSDKDLSEIGSFFGKTGDRDGGPEAEPHHEAGWTTGQPSAPTRQWFQPGKGISREVIAADIVRYLGPDALVKPGIGTGEYEGVEGYWITAYRPPTSQMMQDLRLDSQRWRAEVQQGRVAYQDSRTHQSRQYYGLSTPSPEPADARHSSAHVDVDSTRRDYHDNAHIHIKTQKLPESQPFTCMWDGCQRRFTRKFGLKQHIMELHRVDKDTARRMVDEWYPNKM